MKPKILIVAILGLAVVAWAALQHQAARQLQQEHHTLLDQHAEAQRLTAENQASGQAIDPAELERLREASRELPKLRNEVRQWREAAERAEKLRAENAALAGQVQSAATTPISITQLEGFVPAENWGFGDFQSAEQALQNLFWAMREGSYPHFRQCLSSKAHGKDRLTEEEFKREMTNQNLFRKLKGYRVVEKRVKDENTVVLHVQFAANSEPTQVPVRREGAVWKVDGF